MAAKVEKDLALYRRLLRQARPHWRQILCIFLLSMLAIPLALLTPLPLKVTVDSVIGDHSLPAFLQIFLPDAVLGSGSGKLIFLSLFLVAIALMTQLQTQGSWLLQTYASEKLVLGLREKLLRHAQRLSLTYHNTNGTADSIYRIQYDTLSLPTVAIHSLIPFVSSLIKLIAMILITAIINLKLALVALAVSPVLFCLVHVYRPRLRRKWRDLKLLESSALSVVQEVLSAIRVVKAFGQEEREQKRFVSLATQGLRARIRVVLTECVLGVLIGLTTALGTAAVLFIGVTSVQSGSMTLGDLLLVMAYLAQLYDPLRSMGKNITNLQQSLASAERAFSLLDAPSDVVERPGARSISRAKGSVALRNVSFSYEGGPPVLSDISFDVAPGSRVGITGRTGSGKTTLISLVTRFYDPTDGQILVDGVDLRDYKINDLRNQFSIVLQEPVLFAASIADNILYARPDATMDEVIAAAKAANAHDFICKLEQGYDTMVGERGLRLSGGERQRISLARAFLKDAPILILDEPTSSVDVETEEVIMEAMERLMKGRTTFIIAHRLNTLESCDVRIHVQDGRLADQGKKASSKGKKSLARAA